LVHSGTILISSKLQSGLKKSGGRVCSQNKQALFNGNSQYFGYSYLFLGIPRKERFCIY
jgi:hypothetical protein